MAPLVSKPQKATRDTLPSVGTHEYQTFWFSGNSSTVEFALPAGWVPNMVFVDGALKRPGAAEDYETGGDGFVSTVTFAVAPGVVDVAIHAERKV